MSVETDPVPPLPSTTPPINKRDRREPFENNWTQWFLQLRDKVNIINTLIVNLSNLTGNGLVVIQNSTNWLTRAIAAGTGITVTNGDGTAGNPTVAHGDTSSVADLSSDNSGTVVIQDVTITFDTFGHVQTATVGTVDVATALAGTFQPLDATLTALAGQNWALNALPIGTGADTVSQVSFAANTFPARASTGDLVAKPITDQALTLLATTSTTNLPEGTNLYFTDARARTAVIAATITNGDTTHSPSGDAVFDALALKADDSAVVHLAGTETITGAKTFSTNNITVSNVLLRFQAGGAGDTSAISVENTTKALAGETKWYRFFNLTGGYGNLLRLYAYDVDGSIRERIDVRDNGAFTLWNNSGHVLDLDTSGHALPGSATTQNIGSTALRWLTMFAQNLSLGANTSSFGGGSGVVFISNATTVPTSNPSGGGVLFVEGGALKYRGSAGTVTTIAPA